MRTAGCFGRFTARHRTDPNRARGNAGHIDSRSSNGRPAESGWLDAPRYGPLPLGAMSEPLGAARRPAPAWDEARKHTPILGRRLLRQGKAGVRGAGTGALVARPEWVCRRTQRARSLITQRGTLGCSRCAVCMVGVGRLGGGSTDLGRSRCRIRGDASAAPRYRLRARRSPPVPQAAAGGGWWSSIDVNRSHVAPGQRVELEETVAFSSAAAAEEAQRIGRFHVYLLRGFDYAVVERAMGSRRRTTGGRWAVPRRSRSDR
jgi:hypothetical protein